MNIKKNGSIADYYVSDSDVLDDSIINRIIGSNEKVRFFYEKGYLDTFMVTGLGSRGSGVTRSLGRRYSCPFKVVFLFRDLVLACCGSGFSGILEFMGIYSCGGSRLRVSICCGGALYSLFFEIRGSEVVFCGGDLDDSISKDIIAGLEGRLAEAIYWVDLVSLAPVYCIEYYANRGIGSLGSGSYYCGVSEAVIGNGVNGVCCSGSSVVGEYAIIFIEE